MMIPYPDPFAFTAEQLRDALGPALPLFPELEAVRHDLAGVRVTRGMEWR